MRSPIVLMAFPQSPPVAQSCRSYFDLVLSFPPRVIRNRVQYRQSLLQVQKLTTEDREPGLDELEYLALLQLLIRKFEGPKPKTGPAALLSDLLDEHRLRIIDLSQILGRSLPLCSMILNGQRRITRAHAVRLGQYFGKGPEHFLA